MYIVFGHYSPDKPQAAEGRPAELRFPTLDQAMQKLRDWVEADEIDTDGPMFIEYGMRLDPLPLGEWQKEAAQAVPPPQRPQPPVGGSLKFPRMSDKR